MDQFNLSRYANLTVQRIEPSEEKPLPRVIENEDGSDEEDDFSGSEEEANKTLEIPKTEGDSEEYEIPTTTNINGGVKLESDNILNESENEIKNHEQNDQDIETKSKRKSGEEEDDQTLKKAKMNEEKTSDEDPDNQTSSDKRPTNLRRNIREVMDETKLDESTLAAQRQEMERLRRVQEQQRIIREVQKQITINRQNSKAQDRVMSLLQGGTTSLIKKSSVPTELEEQTKPNTIVISTDSGSPQIFNKKMLEILKNQPDVSTDGNEMNKLSSIASKLGDVREPHMVTSSVSIAPIKPTKIAEVVTISSGSEEEEIEQKPQSSDDDCILISGDEEEEDIADDDAHNSGMHTNDAYNLPDESGRVLINVGHPDNEPDVFLAPQIARIIKPHQIGGVRFLYDNVVESLERFKSSKGFGCILAHSMGLGKTLQVVSFCDVFLRHTPAKHVLCIMPINTLQNWMAEFNMWLPLPDDTKTYSEDTTKNNNIIYRQFPLFVLNDFHKTISARGKVIHSWRNEGGVLLMGYELYRQLTSRKPRKKRNKKQIDDDFYDEKNKPLLDEMREALVKPGPDLVICDEGHRIKNSHATTSQSLKEIESRRRVVLTGYPLQNNLLEYWCMVDFVRPNYLGTKTEFSNMFERPIQNGQCIDSTPQDIRLMRHRAHVLHSLLEGFVQRRSHSVLEKTLPQKEEYVLLVRMTPLQRLLYDRFMNEVVRKKAVPNPLKAFAVCCKIWNHPDILYYFLKKRSLDEAEIDLDLEEASTPLGTPLGPTPATSPSAAPKRSRNRWPKGGGMNPNSKELKNNPNRKFQNVKKDLIKTPAVATVMPNTSNNQLITPTTHNHNTTAATQPIQANQFDDYSQSQQYRNQGNFTNQQFNNYNQNYNSSYWKEGGNFYRGNPEYYQSNQSSETKSQFPYPQDPRLEVGEIRMVKSEPSYQNYDETSYSVSNDQNNYQNRRFNQDSTQGIQETEQSLHSQNFTSDIHKVNNFSNQGTNKETVNCQSISNISRLQTENITDQLSKLKPKNIRNRKSNINNKQILKNQSINMINSGTHIANNDNDSNLTNQQVISNTKEISFRQAFNQVNNQEIHSNNNQGLFTNNQDILTSNNKGIFGSSSGNNEDLQFTSNHTSLSESNKGIYGSGLIKQGNDNNSDMAVSFEGIFDNNEIMTNHQKSNLNHQLSIQTNISQQNISNSLNNNQGTLNNQSIQNQVSNQIIDNPRTMNNTSVNQGVRNQGMLLCDNNNQGNLTNSSGALQQNHSRPIQHDRSMLTQHQEIDQKFVNQQQHQQQQQQQQPQHQQQHHHNQEQHYQNSDNMLSNRGHIPIRESFINPNNSSNNYNNYMLESSQHMNSQNHNYGNMLPSSPFQNQNILNDQMLHDQEMLLANDQAMLSVLNSTTDANEQALLYNAMVGQPDGQGLLGLLEPPNMLNNQINEYQPAYGPLPSNIKPGLPGGAKTDPESNQYTRTSGMPHMVGRGVGLMSATQTANQTEVKMFPDPNRFNISNSNDSYSRYSNYSSMYPPYTPSTSTPLGSISDILDNIPGPECTYQPPERKNPAPCTMTSQDVNPLPPFRSLENKTKYEFGSTSINADIDKSHEEKSTLFSLNKESRSLDDTIDPKLSSLEEGEIKNPSLLMKSGKEEPGIPYDWAVELFHDYVPGMIEASAKMSLLFAIVEESVRVGDRVLLFSQSLFTLDLIEEFLQRNKIPGKDENWCRNCDYYRLDGSTSASEREKLINDFNICNTVHLFLVSTRAGSLGINLVGANRVIVFDASWNPCHDTQAVCRVYRYGQKKPCFVYRLVTDNCLEKKIYDRQINKQVMADRVVDECNPDAHLSIKEVTNLCWDDGESIPTKDFSSLKDNYEDTVIKYIVENLSSVLTKEPFQHESLFVDRKDKKLSQAEKRLAKRSYEMEKKANSRPMYSYYGQTPTSSLYRNQMGKPMASVRPMQSMSNTSSVMASRNALNRRWIPAEVWQKQGMSAQEMTLPLDVVIPTNAGDRGSIVLKAGQKVMVLKSPKGIYMQLESGKIIAIRTSANNKPNSPALPGQTFSSQQQQPQPQPQLNQPSTIAYNRPQSLESSFNSGPKNDMQQIRNRSNLLRNNPSISITPKHIQTPSRTVQSPSYMPPTHSSAAGSQSSSPILCPSTYPPKLPSSITLTKFDRPPHKSSEIGVQADSANSCYGPRYPPEYPRSFDRYPVQNEYSARLPQPYTNNYPPQYHRPSSSQ